MSGGPIDGNEYPKGKAQAGQGYKTFDELLADFERRFDCLNQAEVMQLTDALREFDTQVSTRLSSYGREEDYEEIREIVTRKLEGRDG